MAIVVKKDASKIIEDQKDCLETKRFYLGPPSKINVLLLMQLMIVLFLWILLNYHKIVFHQLIY